MENQGTIEEDKIEIEAVIDVRQINRKLLNQLTEFEPTGVDNPQPLLASKNISVSDIRTVGKGKHLKFKTNGLDAIAFSKGDLEGQIHDGQKVDLAYSLELDTYNGFEKVQLKVKDIKVI